MGKTRKNNRGQASVMIAMMIMTFLLFFAFVTNTGMLVHAKINLQNAADLAAYAGAATQARQLNTISFLNYEMRRQYKKFLFRYYVMGNMAQKSFPRQGGGGGPLWSPDGQTSYGVPTVCMIFNQKDNYCQISTLSHIEIPPQTLLDAINDTLRGQLQAIESIRENNCQYIGQTNYTLLTLWLYNTDPEFKNFPSAEGPDAQKELQIIRGMAFGLGLVPREVILRSRIDTVAAYLNAPPQTGMTYDQATSMANAQDQSTVERSVLAMYSAYNTLGPHLFDQSSIQLDELTPKQLLSLKDISKSFDTYAVDLQLAGGGAPGGTTPKDCNAFLVPISLQAPVPLGVYKDPTILTYYAVRLRATAHILFSPFGDMDLKAYAAAQPFGSRIGPTEEYTPMTLSVTPTVTSANPGSVGAIPFLPLQTTDSAAVGQGWDSPEAVSAFFDGFLPYGAPASGTQVGVIGQDEMNRAYEAAMVPNPWEGNRYNIMTDAGGDSFMKYFDTNHQATLWAPVVPIGGSKSPSDELQDEITSIFSASQGGGGPAKGLDPNFLTALKQGMSTYVSSLNGNGGENNEGINTVLVHDPLNSDEGHPITMGGGIMLADPTQLKTSWNDVLSGPYKSQGRVGYSVKFVAFDALENQKLSSDGSQTHNNFIQKSDEETSDDIAVIQH